MSSAVRKFSALLSGERAVLLTGAGFCLAFGWAWFPRASASLAAAMPGIFSGTLFSGDGNSAFFAAMGAGFLLCAFVSQIWPARLERWEELFWHGAALVCLAGAALACPFMQGAAAGFLGLCAAILGMCWGMRLLSLSPPRAGAALILAGLLSCVFSGGPVLAWPKTTLALSVSIALILVLLDNPAQRNRTPSGKAALPRDIAPAGGGTGENAALSAIWVFAPVFFALGVVMPAKTDLPHLFPVQLSAAAGLVLGVLCRIRVGGGVLSAAGLAGLGALAVALWVVFIQAGSGAALADGFAEGVVASALAGWFATRGAGVFLRPRAVAGIILATIFALVNIGGLAGALALRAGDTGAALLILVCAALSALAWPAWPKLRCTWRQRGIWPAAAVPSGPAAVEPASPELAALSSIAAYPGLTPREQVVAGLIAQGLSNPQICAKLFLSENTVRTHLKSLYRKTGAANRETLESLLRGEKLEEN